MLNLILAVEAQLLVFVLSFPRNMGKDSYFQNPHVLENWVFVLILVLEVHPLCHFLETWVLVSVLETRIFVLEDQVLKITANTL